VDFSVGAMAFVDEDELDMFLVVQRPVAPAVLEETKARLLEAVARERGPQPFARVQARLFTLGAAAGPEETSLGGFAAYPVRTNQSLTGVLVFAGKAAARIAGDSEVFLQTAAQQAKIVMENSRLFDKVKSLSIRDSLTGLFNHRHTIDQLASEFGRVGRYEGGVSLLMIDIDHFKSVNDELGHLMGDEVLRQVSAVLTQQLRKIDVVCRYGGEEFAILVPQTTGDRAWGAAEKLRRAVEDWNFPGVPRPVTVSIGVADFPQNGATRNELVKAADSALYAAKQAGRNRVLTASVTARV